MGKVKYFENKEYIINSDNGKRYRILENDILNFAKAFNFDKNHNNSGLLDIKESIDKLINITNIFFRYNDESFSNEIIFDFEILLYFEENYITLSEYKNNIQDYKNISFSVLLINKRYKYHYQIGNIAYHPATSSIEKFIFEPHNFILDFSKYILGMNDGNGNYEEFIFE